MTTHQVRYYVKQSHYHRSGAVFSARCRWSPDRAAMTSIRIGEPLMAGDKFVENRAGMGRNGRLTHLPLNCMGTKPTIVLLASPPNLAFPSRPAYHPNINKNQQ